MSTARLVAALWGAAILIAIALSGKAAAQATEEKEGVALTVYNQNMALVKENRFIELKQGENVVPYTNVAAQIEASSVHLKSLTDPNAKVFAGTWQWDGAHWAQRQDVGPGPRSSIAMAFDTARGCAVLFGGVAVPQASNTASSHLLGDTWEEQGSGPPVQVTALTVNPATVAAGGTTTIEADLSQRAPAGGAVVVVTAAGAAGVPNVDVPGGATSASATYTVPADTPPGDVTVTGQLAGSSQTATLHVMGAGGGATMAAFTITPSTMQSSQAANLVFQVDLTAPAPQGGVAVAITYEASSNGTIAIAAGSTSGQITFPVGAGQVNAGQSQFDATLGGQTLSATLTSV